ncbi:MAG: 50S ribosomal protein L18 [Caudoviricetes sp.]|nr:MAG: 50S ribosomal protein L18 [Caudoviricetes sp.]
MLGELGQIAGEIVLQHAIAGDGQVLERRQVVPQRADAVAVGGIRSIPGQRKFLGAQAANLLPVTSRWSRVTAANCVPQHNDAADILVSFASHV